MEDISARERVEFTHVPFRGATEGITAVLGGQVTMIADSSTWAPHVEAGRMRALCVWSAERAPRFPDVPTLRELGHAELNELAVTWFGLVAPARTPSVVVARLNAAAVEALKDPALQTRLRDLGAQPIGNTPDQFGKAIAVTLERVRKVVVSRKIEAE